MGIDLSAFYAMVYETRDDELAGMDELQPWVKGSIHQRDRLVWAARWSLEWFEGNLLEIGCLHGGTTKLLAPLAKEFGRRVLCVDPWVHEPFYGPRDPFEVFLETMEPWKDVIEIVRLESQDPQAISTMEGWKLAFAFVDGLHTYGGCFKDICSVKHTEGFIAVDDTLWSNEVSQAFVNGRETIRRDGSFFDFCRESWILPKGA